MIGQENRQVERKVIAILKALSDSPEPLGGKIIARRLGEFGIDLSERAVRYHLKLMDERGFTHSIGRRDGRAITQKGIEEMESALVSDRVDSITARIEQLAYQTSLNLEKCVGEVPINISLFPKDEFAYALEDMKDAFEARLSVSDLVAVAQEGEMLGEVIIPKGKVGLATVCSIVIGGALLKAGVPLDLKFGGILQLRSNKSLRFTELIEYSGSSLDPAEMFMVSRMTSVSEAASRGEGKILASLSETPAACKTVLDATILKLNEAGISGPAVIGEISETVCGVPVRSHRVGVVIWSGLNPVAAAVEAGITVSNHALSGVIDYSSLKSFWKIVH
jgi:repressor of nif and glnA expression